jgi:hypothetical protein
VRSTTPCTGSRAASAAVHHLGVGEFDESDIGLSCYHVKTGSVELYLNHRRRLAGGYGTHPSAS